jgi:ADP-ribose pyrophosphatase YjhB (NUDIX family)
MQQATLCFLVNPDEKKILLGKKKRGFGVGKYNGYGGKAKDKESIEDTAMRELFEEAGVKIFKENLKKVAELTFTFPNRSEWNQVVHVFTVEQWEGNPKESEEMTAEWFSLSAIPYGQMWQDDFHWLPLVLQGKMFKASFVFAEDNESVKEYYIENLR